MLLSFILYISIKFSNIEIYHDYNQIKKNDTIYWQKNIQLKESDFLGKPKQNVGDKTVPDLGFKIKYDLYGDTLTFICYAYMTKSNSWRIVNKDSVKTDSITTKKLFIHEDGHFNIVELFARKIRRALCKANMEKDGTIKEIESIIDKLSKDCQVHQDLYDKETNHGVNYTEQEIWNKRIDLQLSELDMYKNGSMKVTLKYAKPKM